MAHGFFELRKSHVLNNMGVLFLSYDGMLEPLGQSQVLAYLERLVLGRPIYLISFEKTADWVRVHERHAIRARMTSSGIVWYPLRYHKEPSAFATTWDIAQGILVGLYLVLRYRLSIVHARSYVPSLMALVIKKLTGARYLFDMRGFWADERVDGGLWARKGSMYRIAKRFERLFLLNADHVVSLTHSAVAIMRQFDYLQECKPRFTVIPTCADLTRFKLSSDSKIPSRPFVLGYVGTVGTWYMFDKVAETVAILLRIKPDAKFLVINRGEHHYVRQHLKVAGVPEAAVEIISATHSDMPKLISLMHASIFFIRPSFSKQASSPTKLGELLGCGIPCIANAGVGDLTNVLEVDRVGIVIKSFDGASIHQGLSELFQLCSENKTSERCAAAAHRYFSLDDGAMRYERIYQSLERLA